MDLLNFFSERKKNLVQESGARDEVFCEFDSLLASILLKKKIVNTEFGVPFLHIIQQFEKFVYSMCTERKIKIRFIFFKSFRNMWKSEAILFLRQVLLSHVKRNEIRVDELDCPCESSYSEYLRSHKPFVMITYHEDIEKLKETVIGELSGMAYFFLLTAIQSLEITTYSGILFHSNTFSGYVWSPQTRFKETDTSYRRYMARKKKEWKLYERHEKKKEKNDRSSLLKSTTTWKEINLLTCTEILKKVPKSRQERTMLMIQLLLSSQVIQRYGTLRNRSFKISLSEENRRKRIVKRFVNECYLPCLRIVLRTHNLDENSYEFLLDPIDGRILFLLLKKYDEGEWCPREIHEEEYFADFNFSVLKEKFATIRKHFEKELKEHISKNEEEEEDDDDEEDEGEKEDWMTPEEEIDEEQLDSKFDQELQEEEEEERNNSQLTKIDHDIIRIVEENGVSGIRGEVVISEEKLKERRKFLKRVEECTHWKVDKEIADTKMGYFAARDHRLWMEIIKRDLQPSNLKFTQKEDSRNKQKIVEERMMEWKEKYFRDTPFEEKFEIVLKTYIDWNLGRDYDIEVLLLDLLQKRILGLLQQPTSNDDASKWKVYHSTVLYFEVLKRLEDKWNKEYLERIKKKKKKKNNGNQSNHNDGRKIRLVPKMNDDTATSLKCSDGEGGEIESIQLFLERRNSRMVKKAKKANDLEFIVTKTIESIVLKSVFEGRDELIRVLEKKNWMKDFRDVRYQMRKRELYETIEECSLYENLQDYWNVGDYNEYKTKLGFVPDPFQKELMSYIDENESVVVCTPTSSGKTFLTFYLMNHVLNLESDQYMVFVAPTNALVTQMARDIERHFGKRKLPKKSVKGNKIMGVFTSDDKINCSNCHILVTNAECLHILFLSPHEKNVNWVRKLKYIVFDEVHTINDWNNGDTWERILLMTKCPFLALSASVGNAEEFHQWLKKSKHHPNRNIHLIKNRIRPNFLKYFVFDPRSSKKSRESQEENVLHEIHPCAMLNEVLIVDGERTHDAETEVSNLKKMTPCQCINLYQVLWVILMKKKKGTVIFDPLRKKLEELDPSKYFSEYEWTFIPRNKVEKGNMMLSRPDKPIVVEEEEEESEGEEETIAGYEKDLKKVLVELSKKDIEIYHEVIKDCRAGLFHHVISVSDERRKDRSSQEQEVSEGPKVGGWEELELARVLPKIALSLRDSKRLPALIFHFDRSYVEELAIWLMNYLRLENENLHLPNEEEEEIKRRSKIEQVIEEIKKDRKVDHRYLRKVEQMKEIKKRLSSSTSSSSSEEEEEIEEIEHEDPFFECLRYNIGVHHGQLDKSYRSAVERLFQTKRLKVLLATGTLSYGINVPCKTVVLLGDSMYLTPSLFSQTTGRSGRRGFDTIGNVVTYDISIERLRRLMLREDDHILGNNTITPSYVLRLMIALSRFSQGNSRRNGSISSNSEEKRKNSMIKKLLMYPLTAIRNLDDKSFMESARLSLFHTLRFSLEWLLENDYIDAQGTPINFALLASHLFHTAPSQFLFVEFMKNLLFHDRRKMLGGTQHNYSQRRGGGEEEYGEEEEQEEEVKLQVKSYETILLVLCHLFTGFHRRRKIEGKVLDDLPKTFQDQISEFSDRVVKVFRRYVYSLPRIKSNTTPRISHQHRFCLPFSKISFDDDDEGRKNNRSSEIFLEEFENLLEMKGLNVKFECCSPFVALSGLCDDDIERMEVPEILDCIDVQFDPSLFPIPYDHLCRGRSEKRHQVYVSSVVLDYLNGVSASKLCEDHHVSRRQLGDCLNWFRKKIQKVCVGMKMFSKEGPGGFLEILEDIRDDFFALYFGNDPRKQREERKRRNKIREQKSEMRRLWRIKRRAKKRELRKRGFKRKYGKEPSKAIADQLKKSSVKKGRNIEKSKQEKRLMKEMMSDDNDDNQEKRGGRGRGRNKNKKGDW